MADYEMNEVQAEVETTDLTNCDLDTTLDSVPVYDQDSGTESLGAGVALGVGAAIATVGLVVKGSQAVCGAICKAKGEEPKDREKPYQFWRRTAEDNAACRAKAAVKAEKKAARLEAKKASKSKAPVEETTKDK